MKCTYICKDKNCTKKTGAVFRLEFPWEAIMDINNIAALFCHRCGKEMIIEHCSKK